MLSLPSQQLMVQNMCLECPKLPVYLYFIIRDRIPISEMEIVQVVELIRISRNLHFYVHSDQHWCRQRKFCFTYIPQFPALFQTMLDGRDVTKLNIKWLRQQIGEYMIHELHALVLCNHRTLGGAEHMLTHTYSHKPRWKCQISHLH